MNKLKSTGEVNAIIDAMVIGRILHSPDDAVQSLVPLSEIRSAQEKVKKLLRVDSSVSDPKTRTAAVIALRTNRPALRGRETQEKIATRKRAMLKSSSVRSFMAAMFAVLLLGVYLIFDKHPDLHAPIERIAVHPGALSGFIAQIYVQSPPSWSINNPSVFRLGRAVLNYERVGIPLFLSSVRQRTYQTGWTGDNPDRWVETDWENKPVTSRIPSQTWVAELVELAPPIPAKATNMVGRVKVGLSPDIEEAKNRVILVQYSPANEKWPYFLNKK